MSTVSPHPLDAHTGTFVTAVGAAYPGRRAVFRGRDVHAEVMHDTGWVALGAVAVGHPLTPEQARLLETFWVATSYPDARIWNNRVAALAGSTRSTPGLALAAANAVSEAMVFGRRNEYRALAFIQRTQRMLETGASLAEAIAEHERTQGYLPGYGRPLFNGDERVPAVMALADDLGLADGPHLRLVFRIERHLLAAGRPLRMNAAAMVAGFAADFGMTPRQLVTFLFPVFNAGMQPVYLEALDKPVGAVFAARVDQVDYTGPAPRDWA